MPNEYKMRTKTDCGLAMLTFIINEYGMDITYETVKKLMDWQDYNDFRVNMQDSPYAHYLVCEKLKIPREVIPCWKILRNQAENNKTAILIHDLTNPFLYQHWVALHSVSVEERKVRVHNGKGTLWTFDFEEFQKLYSYGSPACAYIIGRGSYKMRWYEKYYAKGMNNLF